MFAFWNFQNTFLMSAILKKILQNFTLEEPARMRIHTTYMSTSEAQSTYEHIEVKTLSWFLIMRQNVTRVLFRMVKLFFRAQKLSDILFSTRSHSTAV